MDRSVSSLCLYIYLYIYTYIYRYRYIDIYIFARVEQRNNCGAPRQLCLFLKFTTSDFIESQVTISFEKWIRDMEDVHHSLWRNRQAGTVMRMMMRRRRRKTKTIAALHQQGKTVSCLLVFHHLHLPTPSLDLHNKNKVHKCTTTSSCLWIYPFFFISLSHQSYNH